VFLGFGESLEIFGGGNFVTALGFKGFAGVAGDGAAGVGGVLVFRKTLGVLAALMGRFLPSAPAISTGGQFVPQ
jgi:hypothetical protein